ncbi:unnamed protein product, partial [Ectocarpus sp. 13 AM-2016]
QQPTPQASCSTSWIRPSKTAAGPMGRSFKVRWRQVAYCEGEDSVRCKADEHNLSRVAGIRYHSKSLCSQREWGIARQARAAQQAFVAVAGGGKNC